ncbi:aldehyde dehydrogenase family protein, partial [Actinotignum timonense]|uniref:aldehyde dehydrogenase family protein n=2 Tax=Actinomycetaceae TaxID=2049 RepID=UPI002550F617
MAYKTVSPYTGETLKEYPTATDEEVKKAVDVAHNAFLAWRETSYEQRAQVLQKAADLLRERRTEYASIITKEMGKVIGEAEAEVDICIAMFEDYVRNGEKYLATRTLPSDKYGKDSVQLLFQPLGVLFMVEPW